jgi:hypothetical protein
METSLAVEDQTEIAGVSRARRATAPGVAALPSGRADLHVHSFWSDGAQSPEAIVRAARGRVDVVAITDHDEIRGALHGRAFAREHPELGLDVVVGEEISTLNGHLLGLYLEERVPPGLTAFATIELIHAQGGLAVAAHPFHPIRGRASGHRSIGELVPDLPLDAIEVVNNSGVFSWVYDAWAALRNLEWLLPVSGAAMRMTSGIWAAPSRASPAGTARHCAARSAPGARACTWTGRGRSESCRVTSGSRFGASSSSRGSVGASGGSNRCADDTDDNKPVKADTAARRSRRPRDAAERVASGSDI